PDDQQYYFVASLRIAGLTRNAPGSEKERLYGEFAVVVDRAQSHDLDKQFPGEALLRAFTFETDRPIKYGANIGQSLQTLRVRGAADEQVMNARLQDVLAGKSHPLERTGGLWTKCDAVFADYFLKNWTSRRVPRAFLLYDPPPALAVG